MKEKRRIQPKLLITLIGMVFLFSACSDGTENLAENEWEGLTGATDYTAMVPDSVPVRQEALRDRVISSGVIQGQQEAILRTRTGGIIRSINFELGDSLSGGQVLIALDDAIAALTLRQLEQQYEINRADLESKEDLYRRGSLALNVLTQARATVNGLEAQLVQARDALENTRVTTPIGGQVAEKAPGLVIGDQVQPGQQLGRIVDLSTLRMSVSLGQSQVFLVEQGLPAEIRIATPTGTITAQGRVEAISAGSDRRTGSWTALVDFPNPKPEVIRAGMAAEVTIINPNAPVSTVVPDSSLVLRDGKASVFLVDSQNDQPRLVQIRLVDQLGDRVAIQALDPQVSLVGNSVLVSGLTRARNQGTAATN